MYNSTRTTLADYPELLSFWESTYRDLIASSDISDLLTSKITEQTQYNAFTKAMELTSIRATELSHHHSSSSSHYGKLVSIATTLWNPLLATSLSVMKVHLSPPPVVSPAKASSPKTVVPKQKQMNAKSVSKPGARPSPKITCYVPSANAPSVSFKDTATVSNIPHDTDQVYDDLKSYINDNPLLYKKFRYIRCKTNHCQKCRTIFSNTQLTSCAIAGHSPCVPSGWFPHVGGRLWGILRPSHDNDSLDFSDTPPVVEGRLMSFSEYRGQHEVQDITEEEVQEAISNRTESWAAECESISLSPRKRRASSLPPVMECSRH